MKTVKQWAIVLSAVVLLISSMGGCGKSQENSSGSTSLGSNNSNSSSTDTGDTDPNNSDPTVGNGESSGSTNAGGGTTVTGGNSGKTGSSTTKNPGPSTTATAAPGKLDMKGYEFVLGTAYYGNYLNADGVLDPTNPMIKAIAKVEKDYNCKVKFYRFADIGQAGQAIVNSVMSGEKLCDVAQVQFSRARTVAYQDASHNLKTLKGLDLSKNFEKAMTEAFTFNNKVYACNFGNNDNVQGLFFNQDLIKKYVPNYNIYDLYKKGQWTEAKFEEILRKIATASGNKVTPLSGTTGTLAMSTAVNAGGTSYKSGNKVTFGIVTTNGVKALNYVKRLYNDKLWKYPLDNSFATGGAVFVDGAVWQHKNYTNVANMGWVPWPKGDLGKYVVPAADGIAWCVPKTVKKKDYVGVILNALAEGGAQIMEQNIMKLEDNGWNKDAIDVYKWMQNNHQIDMTTGPDIARFSEAIDKSVFTASIQPAAAMEGIRAASQKAFDDYYSKFIR
ncbi:MAG: hypothetical protein PHR14_04255 [Oscillospiraceae bacterium]|nr:hypothetical protein [Oscillospiraceae bacterium]